MLSEASEVVNKKTEVVMYIETKGLKKSYGEGGSYVQVLKGVDIGINNGEMCVIQGTSGSGKSTLLNCIGGLDTIDSGNVTVAGTSIEGLKGEKLSDAGRAFQHAEGEISKHGHIGIYAQLFVGYRKIARTPTKVKQAPSSTQSFQLAATITAPQDILATAQEVVQKVVTASYAVKHLADGTNHVANVEILLFKCSRIGSTIRRRNNTGIVLDTIVPPCKCGARCRYSGQLHLISREELS